MLHMCVPIYGPQAGVHVHRHPARLRGLGESLSGRQYRAWVCVCGSECSALVMGCGVKWESPGPSKGPRQQTWMFI